MALCVFIDRESSVTGDLTSREMIKGSLFVSTFAIVALQIACSNKLAVEFPYKQIVLLNVQGLYGGVDVWISETGEVVCRKVIPPKEGEEGLQETRYAFSLSKAQNQKLAKLLGEHDFFTIKTKDRYGVPDEARPAIHVRSADASHAVAKWAGDRHEDFEAIYSALWEVVELAGEKAEIHRGAHDWDWNPDGFPTNRSIRKSTAPDVGD